MIRSFWMGIFMGFGTTVGAVIAFSTTDMLTFAGQMAESLRCGLVGGLPMVPSGLWFNRKKPE